MLSEQACLLYANGHFPCDSSPHNKRATPWLCWQHLWLCWLQICTVFAQLTVDGKWQGPHVFVVRLRDNNSQLTPGVKILDNGPKMGLNGVDNGQIWFDHVKVPRDALLDKYASVSADGVYSSSIESVSQRFGMTVGGLTTGAQPDMDTAAAALHAAA